MLLLFMMLMMTIIFFQRFAFSTTLYVESRKKWRREKRMKHICFKISNNRTPSNAPLGTFVLNSNGNSNSRQWHKPTTVLFLPAFFFFFLASSSFISHRTTTHIACEYNSLRLALWTNEIASRNFVAWCATSQRTVNRDDQYSPYSAPALTQTHKLTHTHIHSFTCRRTHNRIDVSFWIFT